MKDYLMHIIKKGGNKMEIKIIQEIINKNCISDKLMGDWVKNKVSKKLDVILILHTTACERCFERLKRFEKKA